jgi:hypothetical protein
MLCRVDIVTTDISEESTASITRVKRMGELGTTLAVTNNRHTLRRMVIGNVVPSSPILVTLVMEALHSSSTSVTTRATRRNIPEDDILPAPLTAESIFNYTTSQAGGHITPTTYSSALNHHKKTLVIANALRYIAAAETAQQIALLCCSSLLLSEPGRKFFPLLYIVGR